MTAEWPDPSDYAAAVQNPGKHFVDDQLRRSVPVLNRFGLPQGETGQFACAFHLRDGSANFAVRCFLSQRHGRQERYALLSRHLRRLALPALVDFEFIEPGIRCGNNWFPIVKMEWIEGKMLDVYVDENRDQPQALRSLATQWRRTVESLRGARIAHGDLQHGNVLIDRQGDIRLVDYDNTYIPEFSGDHSPELGHRNYQHPQRSQFHYDTYVDNLPALIIYLSLLAVAAEPDLWEEFYTGENLILTSKDLEQPVRSRCISRLKNSPDQWVSRCAGYVERFCLQTIESVPVLEDCIRGTVPPAPPAIIRVDTPKSGSEWTWGDELLISWAFANTGADVRIELLKAGRHIATIHDSVPIGSSGFGEYRWLMNPMMLDIGFKGASLNIGAISISPGDDYSLRVAAVGERSSVSGVSGTFRIVDTPKPVVKVLSPSQGDEWRPETQQTIKWRHAGIDGSVRIELLKAGKPATTIAPSVHLDRGGIGSFEWKPAIGWDGGNRYAIRITSNVNPTYVGVSSGYFTLLSNRLRRKLEFFAKTWDCARCSRFFEPSGLWVCPHDIKKLTPVCRGGRRKILKDSQWKDNLTNDYFWHRISEVVGGFS